MMKGMKEFGTVAFIELDWQLHRTGIFIICVVVVVGSYGFCCNCYELPFLANLLFTPNSRLPHLRLAEGVRKREIL